MSAKWLPVLLAASALAGGEPRFAAEMREVESEKVCVLLDRQSGASAAILPELGANCFRYRAGGVPVLREPPTLRELRRRPLNYGVPLMVPFACGVSDATVFYRGEKCRMRPNPTGPPIRSGGLIFRRPFRVESLTADAEGARLVCELDSRIDAAVSGEYLWPFLFRVEFILEEGGLRFRFEMTNPGDRPSPVMFGIHPYFSIGAVSVPATRRYGYADNLSDGTSALFGGSVDSDMLLGDMVETEGKYLCRIDDVRLLCDAAFRFINVHFPPGGEAVAVEPLAALPDAARLHSEGRCNTGLADLEPGGVFRCEFKILP